MMRKMMLSAGAALALATPVMAQDGQPPKRTMAELMQQFQESPDEMKAVEVVKTWNRLRAEGHYLESMKYVSTSFRHHMTPNRMSKNGKTAYENWMDQAKKLDGKPKGPPTPVQFRGSEDMVTVFHAFGCDIFRVQANLITDHWDCTPWEPFSSVGERKQLQDMAAK